MSLHGLTARQNATLDFIRAEISRKRVPPTMQEIADHLGLKSKSGAFYLVAGLAERGHITVGRRRERSIALTPDAATYPVRLPNDVHRRLHEHVAARPGIVAADVIVAALSDYLRRQP